MIHTWLACNRKDKMLHEWSACTQPLKQAADDRQGWRHGEMVSDRQGWRHGEMVPKT